MRRRLCQPGDVDRRAASEVFDLRIEAPPLGRKLVRRAAYWISNIVGEGHGMPATGGRRAVVTEPPSDRAVATVTESSYETADDDFSRIVADFAECSADEFRQRWVAPPSIVSDA